MSTAARINRINEAPVSGSVSEGDGDGEGVEVAVSTQPLK
jgi:hypothetical protein